MPQPTASECRAQRMGQLRRQRDDESAVQTRAHAADEHDRQALCLRRWPGILASIRTLVAAYNDGAGLPLLTVADQSHSARPGVTIESPGSAHGSITITVDGSDLCVRTNGGLPDAAGRHGAERRLDCSRGDMETASYLLQDWMERL